MKTLNRALTKMFTPPTNRNNTPSRAEYRARKEALALAAEHKIEIERSNGARGSIIVWPPESFGEAPDTDPWDGDHYAETWADALKMVKHYAGIKPD